MCVCVCACKGVTPQQVGPCTRIANKSTTAVVSYKISYWRVLVAMPGQFPRLVNVIADGTCFSWLRHVLTHIPMQRPGAKRCVHLRFFAKVSSVRPHPRLCLALFSAREVLDRRIKVRLPYSRYRKPVSHNTMAQNGAQRRSARFNGTCNIARVPVPSS